MNRSEPKGRQTGFYIDEFTSHPILLKTLYGNQMLVTSNPLRAILGDNSEAVSQPIDTGTITYITIPDLNTSPEGRLFQYSPANLPKFDSRILAQIQQPGQSISSIQRGATPTIPLNVKITDIPSKLYDYPLILDLLHINSFNRFEVLPELQYLARPGNTIVAYYTPDNEAYLTEVQYDSRLHQINPPI